MSDSATAEQSPVRSDSEAKFGCFFSDGVRRVDYVLVWEENLPGSSSEPQPTEEGKSEHPKFRQAFQANLLKAGVQMEKETTVTAKKRIHFLKLFVTWDAMCYYAEYLRLRAPLTLRSKPPVSECSDSLMRKNPMRQTVPSLPESFYTCAFTASKMQKFIGITQGDSFFAPIQRHLVAHEILCTRVYGEQARCEIGIDRMIQIGVYSCAFPLHEGSHALPGDFDYADYEEDEQTDEGRDGAKNLRQPPAPLNPRQVLRAFWASWCLWHKYQPLEHVRQYFGEKIAFYFAWLGLYTVWLLPATCVGIGVFFYGCIMINRDVPTQEACSSGISIKMCPICDEKDGCQFWHLSDICWKIKMANLFDHPGTALYAVFVSFWAVLFLEYWKRRNAALSHRWGVTNFRRESAPPRPGYSIGCTEYRQNPITGGLEPNFPLGRRIPRMIVGTVCLLLMLVIVVVFILLIILYQTVISIYLFRMPMFRSTAKLIASCSAAAVNLVIMVILEYLYEGMAYKLTEWEMHKTQWKFEDHLTMKIFIFEVCNYYSSIFYIAFFKGRFSGRPGSYRTLFGFRQEECDEGGCLFDLAVTLAIIMIGRQIFTTFIDIFLPKVLIKLHHRNKGLVRTSDKMVFRPWEADYRLLPYNGLSVHYRELVSQFGFITIFVAAFPLAPLFALLKNCVQIRIDARKLVMGRRRPLAERAQGIGIWLPLLEIIAAVSVISNAFLIAFTSDFLPKLLYMFEFRSDLRGYVNFSLAWSPPNSTSEPCRYRDFRDPSGMHTEFFWKLLTAQLAFVIVFEHLVFSVRLLLTWLIPDVPKELSVRIERQNYLGRQALIDADLLMPQQQPQDSKSFKAQVETINRIGGSSKDSLLPPVSDSQKYYLA